jgi:uncharacterized protein (TIGR00290 family)
MTPAPVVLAWSGGKDSSLALQALHNDPRFEPVALLTTVTRDDDRISMHGVRRELLHAQAESAGLALIEAMIDAKAGNESYEASMRGALDEIRARFPGLRHLAFGDLFLEDVRAYRERQLVNTGFTPIFPVWGEATAALARRFIADGFQATLVCVDTRQIDGAFAGRAFDASLLDELPGSADPCGENGEFHTFVADGPIFSFPIRCATGERVLRDDRFAYCDLLPETATPRHDVAP